MYGIIGPQVAALVMVAALVFSMCSCREIKRHFICTFSSEFYQSYICIQIIIHFIIQNCNIYMCCGHDVLAVVIAELDTF